MNASTITSNDIAPLVSYTAPRSAATAATEYASPSMSYRPHALPSADSIAPVGTSATVAASRMPLMTAAEIRFVASPPAFGSADSAVLAINKNIGTRRKIARTLQAHGLDASDVAHHHSVADAMTAYNSRAALAKMQHKSERLRMPEIIEAHAIDFARENDRLLHLLPGHAAVAGAFKHQKNAAINASLREVTRTGKIGLIPFAALYSVPKMFIDDGARVRKITADRMRGTDGILER